MRIILYYIGMENTLNNLIKLEEKITLSLDLLEVAKGYCEYNFDKGQEVVAICSILEVVLEAQKELADTIDSLM